MLELASFRSTLLVLVSFGMCFSVRKIRRRYSNSCPPPFLMDIIAWRYLVSSQSVTSAPKEGLSAPDLSIFSSRDRSLNLTDTQTSSVGFDEPPNRTANTLSRYQKEHAHQSKSIC